MTSEGLHGVVAAAHELKTPLALMSHLAATLGDDSVELTAAQRRVLAQQIHLSAERSLHLVQGLTLAQRFDDLQQLALQFKLEPVNVNHLCKQVLAELTPLAAAHHQTLHLAASGRSYLAVANPELLKSVCYNLLDNAIRHTAADGRIDLAISTEGSFVQLAVADAGPTPGKHDLARIKERLGSHLQPLSGRPGSSGLGLYIAARMAEVMGGSLGMRQRKAGVEFYAKLVQSKQLPLL